MKKLNQSGFSGIETALTILIVGLIGGSGYLVYQRQQDKKEQTNLQQQIDDLKKNDKTKEEPVNQVEAKSEDEKILEAANCAKADICKINEKQEGLAWVVTGSNDGMGGNIYLAQSVPGEDWGIIYEGNGDVPQSTIEKYALPESWLGPSL